MSSSRQEVNVQIHGNSLTLRGNSLRPERERVVAAAASARTPSGAATPAGAPPAGEGEQKFQYVLITLSDSSQATHEAIQATGAVVLSYIADNVYLYKRGDTASMGALQAVRGVRFVDAYPPSVKIHADLRAELEAPPQPAAAASRIAPSSGDTSSEDSEEESQPPQSRATDTTVPLELHFHEGTSDADVRSVMDRFVAAGSVVGESVQTFSLMATADADKTKLNELTAAPEVYVIQPQVEYEEDNIFATDVLSVAGPMLQEYGYKTEPDSNAPLGTQGLPFDGTGQTICVGDSGFDRGSSADMGDLTGVHSAFTNDPGSIEFYCMDPSHNATAKPQPAAIIPSCIADVKGHGTHVCGSAVGFSRQSSVSGAGNSGFIKGSAPGAHLVFTQVATHAADPAKKKIFKGPMNEIYEKTVNINPGKPAPIFSQSWGPSMKKSPNPNPKKPGYDANVLRFDTTIRQSDVLVCRSAGNDGNAKAYRGVCSRYASGKNVLTVGMCQSSTSKWVQTHPDVTSNAALAPQPKTEPGNPTIMSPKSCWGTHEERQKPDVVAPGVDILSAHSRDAPVVAEKQALDPGYSFKSGTSMATPLAAGCAAVLNQALGASGSTYTHSSVLLKALLVNGAVSLLDASDADPQFEWKNLRRWGFGRVNVLNSLRHLPPPAGSTDDGVIAGFKHGKLALNGTDDQGLTVAVKSRTQGCLVDDRTNPSIKVTLCWADEGNEKLQALFFFTLTRVKTGEAWCGNRRGWLAKDVAGDSKKLETYNDQLNNVQQIYCTNVEPGEYRIDIQYYENKTGKVPAPVVPYAMAWLVF